MGFVAEYAHKTYVRVIPFLVQGLGAFLFLSGDQPILLWLATAVYGFGFSGVMITQEVIWANYFGRLTLGLVRSAAYLIVFGFGAIGPVAMNAVFDITGSYKPAFIVIIGLFSLGALLMCVARPPETRRYATGADMIAFKGDRK